MTWMWDEVLGNPVAAWLQAAVFILLGLAALVILRRVIAVRLTAWAGRTAAKWDDTLAESIARLRVWLLAPAVVLAAASALVLPHWADQGLRVAAVVGVAVQLLVLTRIAVDAGLLFLLHRTRGSGDKTDATVESSMGVVRFVAMAVLGGLIILLALDNLGVRITPILAGLGVGGIAVALAVQNILGDLFASVSILMDKPFVVGDFIVVGQQMGTVERIGIKTTRVRALSGEQLVFANSDLLASRIQNFKRMQRRWVKFSFGVEYETPAASLRAIPGIVREAVQHAGRTTFDRCHLSQFGDSALNFEAAYFVESADFNLYMDIQQSVNLELIERFAAAGIGFAYPVQVQVFREARGPADATLRDLPGPTPSGDGRAAGSTDEGAA